MIAATPGRRATVVATEALLLRRRDLSSAGIDLWPVFAVVLDDAHLGRTTDGRALLDRLASGPDLTFLDGTCRWRVLSETEPVLGLSVRSHTPVELAVDVVVPAHALVHALGLLATGPTVGITTRGLAGGLTDVGTALRRMVLTASAPEPELAGIGDARLVS